MIVILHRLFIILKIRKCHFMVKVAKQVSLNLMTPNDLKLLRKKNKWTLRDFSGKVGVSKSLLSAMEKGDRVITAKTSDQIRQSLGLVLETRTDEELRAHLDYLKLTLFETTAEIVMEKVVGIEKKYFHVEHLKRHHYDRVYRCGAIQVYEADKLEQGILLEMSGQGLREFEEFLAESDFELNDWLILATDSEFYRGAGWYSRFNCTRLDIALDEMLRKNGNYNLRDILWRNAQNTEVPLIRSPLRSNGNVEDLRFSDEEIEEEIFQPDFLKQDEMLLSLAEKDWRNDVIHKIQQQENHTKNRSLGLSIKFGSRGSAFFARFYEKAKERSKKERITLEEALLNDPVVNRYEMEMKDKYAMYAFNQLAQGELLHQIGISILLSRIEILEEIELSNGKKAYQYHKPFYDVFGDYTKVRINGKTNKSKLDEKIRWIENQVIGTLSMIREVFGSEWTQNWLNKLMNEVMFTEQQKADISMEKLRVTNHDNGYYEKFNKQFIREKLEMYKNEENHKIEKLYEIRVKGNPLKAVPYINNMGNWDTKIPDGMTKLEIQRLGSLKGIDFFDSELFSVKEVLDAGGIKKNTKMI